MVKKKSCVEKLNLALIWQKCNKNQLLAIHLSQMYELYLKFFFVYRIKYFKGTSHTYNLKQSHLNLIPGEAFFSIITIHLKFLFEDYYLNV